MHYGIIHPPPHLATFVRFYWYIEGYLPYLHRAFAYPCPEIVFCYKGHFWYGAGYSDEKELVSGVFGQTDTFSRVRLDKEPFGILGIYLYPHALTQLFGLPANELTNHYADVRSILGRDGDMLEEQMALASGNYQRAKLVSEFLEARLKNVMTEHNAMALSITAIVNGFKSTSAKALADSNCLSLRQFERRFKKLSGFSPRSFLRIMRFNSVLNKEFQHKSLTEIGIECGYYDQSHFIHDFKKFSGVNPKYYFKEETIVAVDRGTVES